MLKAAAPAAEATRDRAVRWLSGPGTSTTGLIFVLLLATFVAYAWFASTPLLLGGPNAILAGVMIVLSLVHVLRRVAHLRRPWPVFSYVVREFRPVMPVITVSVLLMVWALAVYLFTDTLRAVRIAQMGLGIGVMFGVYLAVDTVYRARLLALVVIGAALVSTLFGMAVLFVGEPFLSTWFHIAVVEVRSLPSILGLGRIAGLTTTTVGFSYQLAAAIPPALAALMYSPFGSGRRSGRIWRAVLSAVLTIMVMGMVVNATRSLVLGALVSAVIVVLPLTRLPWIYRWLFLAVALVAVWLVVLFNPVVHVSRVAASVSIFQGPAAGVDVTVSHLSAGVGGLVAGGVGQINGHTLWDLGPGQRYSAQVRARDEQGFGSASGEVLAAAGSDGSLSLVWREPRGPASITGYQLRLRAAGETAWTAWREFVPRLNTDSLLVGDPTFSVEQKIAVGRILRYQLGRRLSSAEGGLELSARILRTSDSSARARIPMTLTALWYSLDHPLGTGTYSPTREHIGEGLDEAMVERLLASTPHNQFLNVLVYYGYPGLALLVAFYLLILRSLVYSGRYILRSGDASLYFLGTAVVGALAAYGVNSLLHNAGPFVGDWVHFFIVGLAFSIERIVASRVGEGEGSVEGVAAG